MQNIDKEELKKMIKSLKAKGFIYNEADLCQKTGIPQSYLSDMKAGRRPVSEEMLQRIEKTYPDFFGTASGDNSTIANNINGNNLQNSGAVINALIHQLDEKDRQVAKSQEQIDRLLTIIENLNSKQ